MMVLNKEYIRLMILFFVLSFFFLMQSPNHPLICGQIGTDSSVFQTVAQMMNDGYMPYKDSFDHKGPLIYLLNLIGICINRQWGICIVEFIFLLYSLVSFFYISRLATKKISINIFVSLIALCFFRFSFQHGNFTEEYAVPFICTSLYIFLDYILNDKTNKIKVIVSGVCFSCVMLLRPNMISVWIVFCIYILCYNIYHKQYDSIIRFILLFLFGVSIIIIPVIMFLLMNNTLSDFFDAYVLFNIEYSMDIHQNRFFVFIQFIKHSIMVLTICSIFYLMYISSKDRIFLFVYFIYVICTLIMISMSGRHYGHYGMILVPTIIYPISLFIDKMNMSCVRNMISFCDRKIVFIINPLIVCVPILCFLLLSYTHFLEKNTISGATNEVCKLVEQYSSPCDLISVYGNFDSIYLYTQRRHATRYSYQFPIGNVRPKIFDEYFESMESDPPKIIVVQQGRMDQRIKNFLIKNHYYSVSEHNTAHLVFVREDHTKVRL